MSADRRVLCCLPLPCATTVVSQCSEFALHTLLTDLPSPFPPCAGFKHGMDRLRGKTKAAADSAADSAHHGIEKARRGTKDLVDGEEPSRK